MARVESRGEHALVLRIGTFREIDCWVRFFSPARGIETAFAFGGRRSRRRFSGCLDNLNHLLIDLDFPKSGHYLALSQGTLVHRFAGLHRNLPRLGMAVNCIKFLEAVHKGPDQAEPVFNLVLLTLQALNDTSAEIPATFPLLFRAKLACFYGYGPDLSVCGQCGSLIPEGGWGGFSWATGLALCPQCCKQSESSGRVGRLDLVRLHNLLQGTPEDWVQLGRPENGDKQLWQALDFFVQHHTELQWDGGRFRRV
ncbi:MAG: DNA repair protein RecO [Desulfovermiculus sp.]